MRMMRAGCCSNKQYRVRCVNSKGVLLLMAWFFFWYCGQICSNLIGNRISISGYFFGELYAVYLVFPIIALVGLLTHAWADTKSSLPLSILVWLSDSFRQLLTPFLTTYIFPCFLKLSYMVAWP